MMFLPTGSQPMPDRAARFSMMSWLLAGGITLALAVMLGRVAQLQLRPGNALSQHIEPRITRRTELDVRGDIVDRKDRLLSATRFGERVIVDPTLLPTDLDTTIAKLADAMGRPPEEVGQKILAAVVENQHRQASPQPAQATPGVLPLLQTRITPAPTLADDTTVTAEPERRPIRYLSIGGLLTDEEARTVRSLKLAGVSLEKQQIREYPGGADVAPIVGKVAYDHTGLLGAEKLLEPDLKGEKGYILFVRDARGHPIWIEPNGIQPAKAGEDVKLSIDLEIQRMAGEELQKGIEDCDAAGGRCLVIDPISGEVLAMVDILRDPPDAEPFPWANDPYYKPKGAPADPKPVLRRGQRAPVIHKDPPEPMPAGHHRWIVNNPDPARAIHPALGRNRCIEDVYEPGSTFKPFVWSTITELGLATPDEEFNTHYGTWITPDGRTIKDVHTAATMTWEKVLVFSSNIGMIQGAYRLTFQQLHDAVVRFGFGRTMGIGFPGEASGIVTPMQRWSKPTQTSVAFGDEVAVTPIQMVRAFSAFARPGNLAGTLPRLRLTALADGQPEGLTYRVLPVDIATLTRETMKGVTGAMETKYCPPPEGQEWRYTIFGKSGTAKIPTGKAPEGKRAPRGCPGYLEQYRSSFIAGGPIEDPRLVVLVIMDDPGPAVIAKRHHYGAAAAGPVVRRVMERTLAYMGVPASPPPPAEVAAAN